MHKTAPWKILHFAQDDSEVVPDPGGVVFLCYFSAGIIGAVRSSGSDWQL